MNSDTFAAFFGASYAGASGPGVSSSATRNLMLDQTLAATTETEFVLGTDSAASPIAVLSIPTQTAIVGSSSPMDPNANPAFLIDQYGAGGDYRYLRGRPWFNSSSFDGSHAWIISIVGIVIPASNAGNTYNVKLYGGATKGGTLIASTGATAVATTTATFGFMMQATVFWNAGSGKVRGFFSADADGTTPAHLNQGTLSNAYSAAAVANLQFCASMTWGNAAGGVCKVTEFSMAQV